MRIHASLVLATALLAGPAFAEQQQKDLKGQQAAPLAGPVWVGTPVSLDAVKGNAVVLAFWNSDAPC